MMPERRSDRQKSKARQSHASYRAMPNVFCQCPSCFVTTNCGRLRGQLLTINSHILYFDTMTICAGWGNHFQPATLKNAVSPGGWSKLEIDEWCCTGNRKQLQC